MVIKLRPKTKPKLIVYNELWCLPFAFYRSYIPLVLHLLFYLHPQSNLHLVGLQHLYSTKWSVMHWCTVKIIPTQSSLSLHGMGHWCKLTWFIMWQAASERMVLMKIYEESVYGRNMLHDNEIFHHSDNAPEEQRIDNITPSWWDVWRQSSQMSRILEELMTQHCRRIRNCPQWTCCPACDRSAWKQHI